MLKEGEREKTKTYQAVVWVARPLTDADLQTLLAVLRASRVGVDQISAHTGGARTRMHAQVKALEVHQLTPIRVLHRRTLLNRWVSPRASSAAAPRLGTLCLCRRARLRSLPHPRPVGFHARHACGRVRSCVPWHGMASAVAPAAAVSRCACGSCAAWLRQRQDGALDVSAAGDAALHHSRPCHLRRDVRASQRRAAPCRRSQEGQAVRYIKEFVHGDLGRTRPSLGSLLQSDADILQLDVTHVQLPKRAQ